MYGSGGTGGMQPKTETVSPDVAPLASLEPLTHTVRRALLFRAVLSELAIADCRMLYFSLRSAIGLKNFSEY